MSQLKFKNLVFKDGENITCRRGVKWATDDGGEFGFPVTDPRGFSVFGFAEPVAVKVKRFCDITDADVVNEHDPDCRTAAGLLAVMQDTYDGFDASEIVTLLSFRYTPSDVDPVFCLNCEAPADPALIPYCSQYCANAYMERR